MAWEAYFRFITTPGIDPTNNLAEQAIRFVVIDRHITQGTRSEKGRRGGGSSPTPAALRKTGTPRALLKTCLFSPSPLVVLC